MLQPNTCQPVIYLSRPTLYSGWSSHSSKNISHILAGPKDINGKLMGFGMKRGAGMKKTVTESPLTIFFLLILATSFVVVPAIANGTETLITTRTNGLAHETPRIYDDQIVWGDRGSGAVRASVSSIFIILHRATKQRSPITPRMPSIREYTEILSHIRIAGCIPLLFHPYVRFISTILPPQQGPGSLQERACWIFLPYTVTGLSGRTNGPEISRFILMEPRRVSRPPSIPLQATSFFRQSMGILSYGRIT